MRGSRWAGELAAIKLFAEACHERLQQLGVRVLSDAELLTLVLSPTAGMNSTRDAAQKLLDARPSPRSPGRPRTSCSSSRGSARRAPPRSPPPSSWAGAGRGRRPKRGERVLDPGARPRAPPPRRARRARGVPRRAARRPRTAHQDGQIAEGSLTQCPVSPRDVLREPVRIGAHGVVFVHNHPSSGDPPQPRGRRPHRAASRRGGARRGRGARPRHRRRDRLLLVRRGGAVAKVTLPGDGPASRNLPLTSSLRGAFALRASGRRGRTTRRTWRPRAGRAKGPPRVRRALRAALPRLLLRVGADGAVRA